MKQLLELYLTFSRIALFAFGGGYAMLPLIQKELVEKKQWITKDDLADYYAIGQCTPGIIAINIATFTGYRRQGIAGGITATLGFITPALFLVTLIAALLSNFSDYPIVQNAFAGIRICVCVLIFQAITTIWKTSVTDLFSLLLCIAVAVLAVFFSVSPVLLVLASGAAGVLIQALRFRKTRNTAVDTADTSTAAQNRNLSQAVKASNEQTPHFTAEAQQTTENGGEQV